MKYSKIVAVAALSLAALPAIAQQFTAGESSAYCAGLMAAALSKTQNKVFEQAGVGFLEVLKVELQTNRITEQRATFILEGSLAQAGDPAKGNVVLPATRDCLKVAVEMGYVK
jgi:hypothetical protein